MEPRDFLVALGTGGVRHTKQYATNNEMREGSFLDHLTGTESILSAWDCPTHLCHAGLFHSIYGTESFQAFSVPLTTEARSRVRGVIGERAEMLAFVNCVMERDSLDRAVARFHANARNRDLLRATVDDSQSAFTIATRPGRRGDSVTHDPRTGSRKAEVPAQGVALTAQQLLELLTLHLADWLQQVVQENAEHKSGEKKMSHSVGGQEGFYVIPPGGYWGIRHVAYQQMAEIVGGAAMEMYSRVQSLIDAGVTAPAYWVAGKMSKEALQEWDGRGTDRAVLAQPTSGGAPPAPALSAEQVRKFRQEGFCMVPNFFNADEVEAMRRQVQAFKREGMMYDQAAADTDGQNYQFHWLSEVSHLFRALPWAERVQSAVTSLLAHPHIEVHLDQMFLKPAGTGTGTTYHQDNGYFTISDPLKGTGMWIAIDQATEENGTMRVVPRSHLGPTLEHRRDAKSAQLITCEDHVNEAETVPCVLEPGGVVFFCYGVIHGTKENHSAMDRSGVAYHFVSSDHIVGEQTGHQHRQLVGRSRSGDIADGGKSEYGESMVGRWETEVASTVSDPSPQRPSDFALGRIQPRPFFKAMVKKYHERNKETGRVPSSRL